MGRKNKKTRYYFGIDLGTTNSVLAWAEVEQGGKFIEPEVVEIRVPGKIGQHQIPSANEEWPHVVHEELLPSCVCFPYGRRDPIVGPHAKGELIRTPAIAVKSIKTKMGTDYSHNFHGTEYSAPEISAKILEALIDGVPVDFPKEELLKEVVIGVPASFEDAMREATLVAARRVGFCNPILLDEPHAALYDYRNQQEQGKFPPGTIGIEFSAVEPKLILVFDLGGGTLDVSLHEVTCGEKNKLHISKSVVSRYTAIGGDNFDSLIAAYFLEKTGKPTRLKPFVQEYTELVKIALSRNARKIIRNGGDPNHAKETISIPVLGSCTLTLPKYKEIVSPLLAYSLTLKTVNSNNIVYPIIDVLKKWEERFGSIPTPDAVLLNGSMTRFYTIQERLKHFFRHIPISNLGDPEIAVARGAVIKHYNIHN